MGERGELTVVVRVDDGPTGNRLDKSRTTVLDLERLLAHLAGDRGAVGDRPETASCWPSLANSSEGVLTLRIPPVLGSISRPATHSSARGRGPRVCLRRLAWLPGRLRGAPTRIHRPVDRRSPRPFVRELGGPERSFGAKVERRRQVREPRLGAEHQGIEHEIPGTSVRAFALHRACQRPAATGISWSRAARNSSIRPVSRVPSRSSGGVSVVVASCPEG